MTKAEMPAMAETPIETELGKMVADSPMVSVPNTQITLVKVERASKCGICEQRIYKNDYAVIKHEYRRYRAHAHCFYEKMMKNNNRYTCDDEEGYRNGGYNLGRLMAILTKLDAYTRTPEYERMHGISHTPQPIDWQVGEYAVIEGITKKEKESWNVKNGQIVEVLGTSATGANSYLELKAYDGEYGNDCFTHNLKRGKLRKITKDEAEKRLLLKHI